MPRLSLLVVLLLGSVVTKAQRSPTSLEATKRISFDLVTYLNNINGPITKDQLDSATAKFQAANLEWNSVLGGGDPMELRVVTYFRTMTNIMMGHRLYESGDFTAAYPYYLQAGLDIGLLYDKNFFPVTYQVGQSDYELDEQIIFKLFPRYYAQMALTCKYTHHDLDAANYAAYALGLESLSDFDRLSLIAMLINDKVQKNILDKQLLLYELSFGRVYKRSDSTDQKYFPIEMKEFFIDISKHYQQLAGKDTSGEMLVEMAQTLYWMGELERAIPYFREFPNHFKTRQEIPHVNDYYLSWSVADATISSGDKFLAKWALWLIKQDVGFEDEKLSLLKAIDLCVLIEDREEKKRLQQKFDRLDKKN